jgi:DNA-binding MarR family transcriptional regulator
MRGTTVERQKQVLAAIRRRIADNGYPPTQREIAREIGVSLARVAQVMARLVEAGMVKRAAGSARAYLINEPLAAAMLRDD